MATASMPHRAGWNILDFVPADVAVLTGAFRELGRKTVAVGEGFTLGFANLAGQENALGRIFMDSQLAAGAGACDGDIRFDLHDPADRCVRTILEARTEQLRTSPTVRPYMTPLPEIRAPRIGPNWSIVLKIRPDANGTFGIPESLLWMDVTQWRVQ